jgi:hypothetical protein
MYFMFQFDTWTSNDSIEKYFLPYLDDSSYGYWQTAVMFFPGSDHVAQNLAPLRVWPQPAFGTLYVSNAVPREEIYLIDPLGRRIRSWKPELADNHTMELDLHGLTAGVYFLCSENFTCKVILAH